METIEDYLQHFTGKLFQHITSYSHDSDRWQSSWHHSTLFHDSFFFLLPSCSLSCAFAAMEVCCVLKCWRIIHLGRHIVKQDDMCEARDFWASLSMPGRLFCKAWKSVLFTCWVLALQQGTSQVKKHLPKSATSSRSNSENSRDKCVNDSEWLMLSQMEQLFMNVNVHIKLFVCGYDIQTP